MNEEITEDSPEVWRAARALAFYYDGDVGDAETWVSGAVVALRAACPTSRSALEDGADDEFDTEEKP